MSLRRASVMALGGIKDYLKPSEDRAPQLENLPEMSEKQGLEANAGGFFKSDYSPFASRLAPMSGPGSAIQSYTPSIMSEAKSSYMEDIKHEVMVNYLFQQQCARLWVGDGSGEVEGVLLRRFRGSYLACPPALIDSTFAKAVNALNLQVCTLPRICCDDSANTV